MLKIKKVVLLQNISVALGILAFIMSIFSIYSVSTLNDKINNFNNNDFNGSFRPIKDIQGVEILNKDGSIVKVHAEESSDELGKIINTRQEKNNNNSKKNINVANNKGDRDVKKQLSNSVKYNKPAGSASKNNKNVTAQTIKPQPRQSKRNENNDSVVGNFIVQIGAFKDKSVASKQCQKARPYIEGRRCGVVAVNEQMFRAVVYPFAANEIAVTFANKLTNVLGTACIAKKNG